MDEGLTWLEERTGKPVIGLIHHFRDIHIPEEDSVALDLPVHRQDNAVLDIAVVQVPHISNFDDFDPLDRENGVSLRYVESVADLGQPRSGYPARQQDHHPRPNVDGAPGAYRRHQVAAPERRFRYWHLRRLSDAGD